MFELITEFLKLIKELCKENPSVFLIFFLLSFSLNIFLITKVFRKAKKNKKQGVKKIGSPEINKVLIYKARVEVQLKESKNRETKLEIKIDEANQEILCLSKKNTELETENRLQKQEIKKFKQENKKLSKRNKY